MSHSSIKTLNYNTDAQPSFNNYCKLLKKRKINDSKSQLYINISSNS